MEKKMKAEEIFKHIDHTLLKPYATWEEIQHLCDEAVQYGTASVCIPPSYIRRVSSQYGNKLNICTVIGFPLGYSCTQAKLAEIQKAIEDGWQPLGGISISHCEGDHVDMMQSMVKRCECDSTPNVERDSRIDGKSEKRKNIYTKK